MSTAKLALGVLAVAFLTVACRDAVSPEPTVSAPNFKKNDQKQCPIRKFTGGGRIDPGAANSMNGKVTFGFNIHVDHSCNVIKGELQVVHHPSHTKFHSHLDPASTTAFEDGTCVTFTGIVRTKHGSAGPEDHDFLVEACDNGEGKSPGTTGPDTFQFATTDATSTDNDGHGDTGDQPLTGGNIQAH